MSKRTAREERLSRQEPHKVASMEVMDDWSYGGEGRSYGEMIEDGWKAVGEGDEVSR